MGVLDILKTFNTVGTTRFKGQKMREWNGWYHVNGTTYGTWLRGDSRGWRARHHREHVNGDYKNPPPKGKYANLEWKSRSLMKQPAIHLSPSQRPIAGQAIVEMLVRLDIEVLALSVDAVHYHILARFPDGNIRLRVGRAKKHASEILTEHGLKGTVWAKRCRPLPITDRAHQLNVFDYILKHADKGAWVWTFRNGLYWSPNSL